jgi:hypothetical protein
MAKSKQNSQVEKAIKKIEDRYAIGQTILKQCGPTSPHGLITELAEQYGINRDHAQKLRAMASKETGYTKAELNQWFKRFREEDYALSISHFIKLISVREGKERDHITQEALTNRWSSHRLQAEILAVQGRRQIGGRKPKVATGDEFEAELTQTLWSWNRWLTLHLEANTELRPELSKAVKSVQKKIAELSGLLDVK